MNNAVSKESKKNNGHSGHGFIGFLIVITWAFIAIGFVAVKLGILQPSANESVVSEKITAIESQVSLIDDRVSALEEKLSNAASILSPAPVAPATPVETKSEEAPAANEPTENKIEDTSQAPVEANPAAQSTDQPQNKIEDNSTETEESKNNNKNNNKDATTNPSDVQTDANAAEKKNMMQSTGKQEKISNSLSQQ